jgi:hypothetical protein
LQPAGLMVLDRNRQGFGNRCHNLNFGYPTWRPSLEKASPQAR